jgi:uncharacterized membrane protein (DUF485 family)
MSGKTARDILADRDFLALAEQKRAVSFTLTLAELVLYFGFIGLIAFDKPFLSRTLPGGSAMTIGIVMAVGAIILSWALTGIYVWWANTTCDALVRRVRGKIGD